MPRGGRRAGKPGGQYPNRSDMRVPMQAATGQAYGVAKAQMDAQRAIPVAAPPAPVAAEATGQPAPPGPLPGSLGFAEETQRPDEPVTAGMALGPGAGPEALGLAGAAGDAVGDQLRAAYMKFPTEELRRLIEFLDEDD